MEDGEKFKQTMRRLQQTSRSRSSTRSSTLQVDDSERALERLHILIFPSSFSRIRLDLLLPGCFAAFPPKTASLQSLLIASPGIARSFPCSVSIRTINLLCIIRSALCEFRFQTLVRSPTRKQPENGRAAEATRAARIHDCCISK